MASRYPLVVNTAIPRIEELKGVDDLNLSQSSLELSNGLPSSINDIVRYNGTELEWISGDSFIGSLGGFTGVVRQSETQTLTNKTISGTLNTLVDIPNSSLVNDFIVFGTQTVFLGETVAAIDTDSRYEITGAGAGGNAVDLQLDVYNLQNNPVSNPTPNGDTSVRLQVAGDLTLGYDSPTKTITITSTFVDTNTTYSVSGDGGLSTSGTSFLLKNSATFTDNTILKWDNTNNQLANTSLTESGADLQTTLNFTAPTLRSTGNSTIGGTSAALLQLRDGVGITRQNSTIRAFIQDGTPDVVSDLFYDSSTGGGNNSSWNITDESGATGAIGYIRSDAAPGSNSDTGRPGEIILSGGNLYLCVAENTWVFAPVTTTFTTP